VDYDLALESAKSWLFVAALSGTYQVDDWRPAAANSYQFSIFDGFNERGKLIFGVCNTDFHFYKIAIYYGYVKRIRLCLVSTIAAIWKTHQAKQLAGRARRSDVAGFETARTSV
jgi:hypothetical protein